MDKNNQAIKEIVVSDEIVVSKRISMMALCVVSLTSLSFIGAFMLRKYKTAIIMLLIQIPTIYSLYVGGYANLLFFPLWLCVWSWGLNLTTKAVATNNGLNVRAKRATKIATFFMVGICSLLFLLITQNKQ